MKTIILTMKIVGIEMEATFDNYDVDFVASELEHVKLFTYIC